MNIKNLGLKNSAVIKFDTFEDARGSFVRLFCHETFNKNGFNANINQCSISFNKKKGTLRGLHYQKAPFEEDKIVRCVRGKIYDVIVDLDQESPSYLSWRSIELNEKVNQAIYVPKKFAHGFQTLEDNTEILYMITEEYNESSATGIHWKDPTLAIPWPICNPIISDKDNKYPTIL